MNQQQLHMIIPVADMINWSLAFAWAAANAPDQLKEQLKLQGIEMTPEEWDLAVVRAAEFALSTQKLLVTQQAEQTKLADALVMAAMADKLKNTVM